MARGPEEAEAAFATISQERADAVVVQGIFFSKTITELALKYRLPTASVGWSRGAACWCLVTSPGPSRARGGPGR